MSTNSVERSNFQLQNLQHFVCRLCVDEFLEVFFLAHAGRDLSEDVDVLIALAGDADDEIGGLPVKITPSGT